MANGETMSDETDSEVTEESRSSNRGHPGNQFWKLRSRHGRSKIFANAALMWESCLEYFQWCHDNPLIEHRVAQYQGGTVDVSVKKMRAMTVEGLSRHFGANSKYLHQFEQELDLETQEGKDFASVIADAKDVMRQQKFEGAAADMLNPTIIARDLSLRDRAEVDHTSSDGSMTPAAITRTIVYPDGKVEQL
jgi:hypothetical protein